MYGNLPCAGRMREANDDQPFVQSYRGLRERCTSVFLSKNITKYTGVCVLWNSKKYIITSVCKVGYRTGRVSNTRQMLEILELETLLSILPLNKYIIENCIGMFNER